MNKPKLDNYSGTAKVFQYPVDIERYIDELEKDLDTDKYAITNLETKIKELEKEVSDWKDGSIIAKLSECEEELDRYKNVFKTFEEKYQKDIENAMNFGYVKGMILTTDKLVQLFDNNEFKNLEDVKKLLEVMRDMSKEELSKIKGK